MATLAEELLNDFADSGSDGEGDERGSRSPQTNGDDAHQGQDGEQIGIDLDGDEEDEDVADADGDMAEAEEEAAARKTLEKQSSAPKDMKTVASFMANMEPVLEKIAYYKALPPEKQTKNIGNVEENPEYQLLTKSNSLSTSIDDHAADVHKFIRDHYSRRFPELETLLPDALEYTKAVAIIGNGPMSDLKSISTSSDNIVGKQLNFILSRPKLMTVTVEATTSKGQDLSEAELKRVRQACKTMLDLDQAKHILTNYVQSRMNLFAPNLTRLIGSLTAAQLLNARGGLAALARTPSSNIANIGSKRPTTAGFATNVGIRSQGYLYDTELISRFRPELRTQAMRILSAKVVLAARIDRVHDSPDGSSGDQLREDCEKRLDKLMKPPPNKGQRALPAPDEKKSKKRGGRRARKAKEATAVTDIRRAQNRMAFGKEEKEVGYGVGDSTVGLGMIGQANDGRVRALQVDQRTIAKLSKKNPGWGGATPGPGGTSTSLRAFSGTGSNATPLRNHGLRTSGVATSLSSASGTASSLAFDRNRSIELVDPKIRAAMERKEKADNDRWFKGGTFTQVGGGSSVVPGAPATTSSGGFKVPALPAKRKEPEG